MFLGNIIGHKRQLDLLIKSLQNNRIAHAYLFIGPKGIGKSAVAHGLASALLCLEGNYQDCSCLPCRKVQSFNHPDLHWFSPVGNKFKIEQIREVQKQVLYKPYEGSKKVFILEDADTMTVEAANSLLKVLEEPPQDTIFILLANSGYGLLPTILSRCQQLHFNTLSNKDIITIIKTKGISEEQGRLVAPLAKGSVGNALELAQSEEAMAKRKSIIQQLENMNKIDHLRIFKLAEEMEKDKEQLNFILDIFLFWYRDLLIWKEAKREDLLVNIDIIEIYRSLEKQISKKALIKAIEVIEESRRVIAANTNLRLALEGMLIQLKGAI